MQSNPLTTLSTLGQSVWLDSFRRRMIRSGELATRIADDDLRGVTSNPSIFGRAILETHDYDDAIQALQGGGKSAGEIYESLVLEDIRMAADTLRPVYDRLEGRDGFVSLEVSPHLAYDTAGSILEARRLWAAVDRPNLLIKIPATAEGLPAIQVLLSEGINVNVTLLFGLTRYRQVTEAHLSALEFRAARQKPVDRVASVASFFLSRIDSRLDPLLEAMALAGGSGGMMTSGLVGQVAVAQAKMAYQSYRQIVQGARFRALVAAGARPQRLLWASTSTKNPFYSDVKYVESLIGPDTVNTMPPETIEAYRDHGSPALRLTEWTTEAQKVLAALPGVGIDMDTVAGALEAEGVRLFIAPFDRMMAQLGEKAAAPAR